MPLRRLIARLRRDCAWDRAQTLRSMRPYLLEEAYEVLDALDADDPAALNEELGDLLFQVEFLAQLLSEEHPGLSIDSVARGVAQKMIERHPHVFAAGTQPDHVLAAVAPVGELPQPEVDAARGASDLAAWEARKAASRPAGRSRVDGVPAALPSLLRAHRVGEKLAHVGFDWTDVHGVLAKLDEERAELAEAIASGNAAAIVHEYGDVLLAAASLGRFLGVPGEDALRQANERFEGRFRVVERLAAEQGVRLEDAGAERLDALWRAAKVLHDAAGTP